MNGHILLQKFDLSKGSCRFFCSETALLGPVLETINWTRQNWSKTFFLIIHFIWRFFPCYTCHARILENTFLSTKKKKKKMRKNVLKSFCLVACVFELFWKNSSYIIYQWFWLYQYLCGFVALWLCVFVSLYVRMFVAEANKVEGTTSWCVRTNEILASNR